MTTLKIKNNDGTWENVFALKGDPGQSGVDGVTPNITLKINVLAAGSTPTVIKSGTDIAPVYTLGIPMVDQANKDGSGNVISSTYLKKAGDTVNGNLAVTGTLTIG